jgi:hypothetical protein
LQWGFLGPYIRNIALHFAFISSGTFFGLDIESTVLLFAFAIAVTEPLMESLQWNLLDGIFKAPFCFLAWPSLLLNRSGKVSSEPFLAIENILMQFILAIAFAELVVIPTQRRSSQVKSPGASGTAGAHGEFPGLLEPMAIFSQARRR